MDERQENHRFSDLCVSQTDSARKSRLCIDSHSACAFGRELFLVRTKEWFKLRTLQSNDPKIRFHALTMSILS
jgi:hypothetical protein